MNPCDVCAYLANENVNHDEQGRFASGPGGAQTDTPEFKEWFKGSKVVNADGKPLMVYHGTRSNFTTFNTDPKSYVLNRTLGAHFAENPDITNAFTAGQYAMASDYNVSNRPDESWYREDGDIRMDGLPVLVKREEHGQESVVEPYDYEKHGSAMWGLKEPYKKDYAVRMLKPGGQGIPVFLNIKNPLVVSPDKNTSDDTAVDHAADSTR